MADITNEELKEILENNKKMMEQNQKIMSENAELKGLLGETLNGGANRTLKKGAQRQVEVRLIDGKVAIAYQNKGTDQVPRYIYSQPDPQDPRQDIDMVDVIVEGSKEPIAVPYRDFRKESQRASVPVASVEEEEWTITQGVVKRKQVEEYSSIELDYDVPLEVTGKTRVYVVDIPRELGGPRQVRVPESHVNIA